MIFFCSVNSSFLFPYILFHFNLFVVVIVFGRFKWCGMLSFFRLSFHFNFFFFAFISIFENIKNPPTNSYSRPIVTFWVAGILQRDFFSSFLSYICYSSRIMFVDVLFLFTINLIYNMHISMREHTKNNMKRKKERIEWSIKRRSWSFVCGINVQKRGKKTAKKKMKWFFFLLFFWI